MIRLGSNWYITLADLSLILFMVAGHAVTEDGVGAPGPDQVQGNPLPAEGEPVAVYRVAAGAPPLRQWLDSVGQDDRLLLTIIGHHAGPDAAEVTAQAAALAAQAGQQGTGARILVEPGPADELLAVLSYDRPDDGAKVATGKWHGDCSAGPGKGLVPGKDKPCD